MNRLLLTRTAPTIPHDASILSRRSPAETTLLPSSARRWARQRTRRGSRADLWTCSTSSCRRTRGADSAAMTTTSRTCRDPSWSDRWPKSAWWGRNWGVDGRGKVGGNNEWRQGRCDRDAPGYSRQRTFLNTQYAIWGSKLCNLNMFLCSRRSKIKTWLTNRCCDMNTHFQTILI